MKKTICFLFLSVMLTPTLSFAATFWGEDLPLVETIFNDGSHYTQYRAKVSLASTSASSTKQLEVWEQPEGGNFSYYYRLELDSGTVYYQKAPIPANELVPAEPSNDSTYPVVVRRMERIVQKIKEGTIGLESPEIANKDHENAAMIAGYLNGNILRKFPQINPVDPPAEVPANESFALTLRVTGDVLQVNSIKLLVWSETGSPFVIATLSGLADSVDAKRRGLYQFAIPASMVSGGEFRWSAEASAKTTTAQSILSVKDEKPDHLELTDQKYPFFRISIH